MVANRDERSLGELFAELSRETAALVRQEVALAKTELSEKAARLGRSASMVGIGGALGHAGLLTLIAALVIIRGQRRGADVGVGAPGRRPAAGDQLRVDPARLVRSQSASR